MRTGLNAYLVQTVRDAPHIAREHILDWKDEEEDDPSRSGWQLELQMTPVQAMLAREHLLFFLSSLISLGVQQSA